MTGTAAGYFTNLIIIKTDLKKLQKMSKLTSKGSDQTHLIQIPKRKK